jgi:hypothetical protein
VWSLLPAVAAAVPSPGAGLRCFATGGILTTGLVPKLEQPAGG